ncbi:hypothetical protein [Azospirillum sp. ST 5-10]|uniref:hypothetical protein n=1 Tax=unclassified Azospirillum TaxID=2630922 RepID=UPI003F4A0F64
MLKDLTTDDIGAAMDTYRLSATRYGDAVALDLMAEALIARHAGMAKADAIRKAAVLVTLTGLDMLSPGGGLPLH